MLPWKLFIRFLNQGSSLSTVYLITSSTQCYMIHVCLSPNHGHLYAHIQKQLPAHRTQPVHNILCLMPTCSFSLIPHRENKSLLHPQCLTLPWNLVHYYYYYYCCYYQYSTLGLVWAGTRAQSGDQYGFGTLHPGLMLRGSLPLLSLAFRRSEGRRAEDFFALKIRLLRPANLGTKSQHATPRPPKPLLNHNL